MRALRLDTANLEQERSIVKEERRVNFDNSIEGAMSEMLTNFAFIAHPYHWDAIGFMKDIDAIRLKDARAYFRTYYAPNNAVVAVVGDFQTPALFASLRKYFGSIPRQNAPPPVINSEPPQQGERRIAYNHAAELPSVLIGYHIGNFTDPDDPVLDVLARILAGGESSRLYRSLVYEKQIATDVQANNDTRLDPSLFSFSAQAAPGHTSVECEAAIYAAIETIHKSGVTEQELQKAKNGLRVGVLSRYKTNLGRASLLARAEASWGDWKKAQETLPRYDRVTAADVQRVAGKYFSPRNRTVITLIPEKQEGEGTRP